MQQSGFRFGTVRWLLLIAVVKALSLQPSTITMFRSRQVNSQSQQTLSTSATFHVKSPTDRYEFSGSNPILAATADQRDDQIPDANPLPASTATRLLGLGYRTVAAAYLFQVLLALGHHGPTLAFANVVGGPWMACGSAHLLSTHMATLHSDNHRLSNDTFKKLNGLFFLYSAIELGRLGSCLWFTTNASACLLVSWGFVQGFLFSSGSEKKSSFWSETKCLLTGAQRTTLALPKNLASFGYSCALAVIAVWKSYLCWEALPQLATVIMEMKGTYSPYSPYSPLRIFSDALATTRCITGLRVLAKLTMLGGTLVILKDAAQRGLLNSRSFWFLNLLSASILSSTAGTYQHVLQWIDLQELRLLSFPN